MIDRAPSIIPHSPPVQATEWSVFLSNASDDKPVVVELARRLALENLRPRLDKWNFFPRAPWQNDMIKNSIGMKLKLSPAGSFLMGATPDDAGADYWPIRRTHVPPSQTVGFDVAPSTASHSVRGPIHMSQGWLVRKLILTLA
jgi:hypothetical protein